MILHTTSYTLLPSTSLFLFFFNDTATTEIYTLSLHDALPISQHPPALRPLGQAGPANTWRPHPGLRIRQRRPPPAPRQRERVDRKSTRLNSSHTVISYAVFCLKKEEHTPELQSHSDLVCRLLLGIQPQAIADSARAVASFAAKARELEAVSTRVIATSAARDAVNPAELTSAIEQASGLKVEIISGEQEADWVFRGVTTAPELASQPLLLVDVGGGSTEIILGRGRGEHFAKSYPLGTLRLLELLPPGDLPAVTGLVACRKWVGDFLAKAVRPDLEPALERETRVNSGQQSVQLIGTGGTAAVLARMEARLESHDRRRIEATRLGITQTKAQGEGLWGLPLAERKKKTGLP